jgi:hypothetical protein
MKRDILAAIVLPASAGRILRLMKLPKERP